MTLSQEEKTEVVELMVKANTAALREFKEVEMKEFFISRKTHSDHHEFLGRLISTFDSATSLIGRTVLVAIILSIIGLIALGFWVKLGGGKP